VIHKKHTPWQTTLHTFFNRMFPDTWNRQTGNSTPPRNSRSAVNPSQKIQDYRSPGCDKTHAFQKRPRFWPHHRANPQGITRSLTKGYHPHL
jgi:hypothetical protein